MVSLGNNLTLINHDDLISLQNGANPLCNHKTGVVAHFFFQRILDPGLGFHIDRTGAVIQDQDCRLHQKSSRDGNALFLPPGEVGAARFNMAVIALRHIHDKVVRLGRFCSRDDLFITCVGMTIPDVVPHRPREQDGFLRHDPDMGEQGVLFDLPDINPIDRDPPVVDIIEARESG